MSTGIRDLLPSVPCPTLGSALLSLATPLIKDEDRLEGMDCKAGQEDSKTEGKEALVRQARGLPKEAIEAAAAPCQEAQQEQAKPVPS